MDEDLLDLSLTPEEQDEFGEEFVSSVVGPEQSSENEREASVESGENEISAAKFISLGKLNKLSKKGFPDSDNTHSNSNQKGKSCRKAMDRKKKIVTPVSDSDSSSSESSSSTSTSSDDSVKKRKVKKSAKKKN
ncbi:zinc finger CCHC domain-containing protein 10-like [Mytilus edulis]|uniref:zinc finger CCHC domain-containing protein 10-like n=1 Tax=Mytilus edulis TaxID=6550 RepID=UPI0039EEFEFE